MKRSMKAVLAAMLMMGASAAFAQASGTMSNDSMSKDAMSKDTMKKDSMSHDSMGKSDKMKKHGASGMDHPASGAMSQ
ncbi:pentapeptide MXKDX repeat protein [Caballeronia sp. J97]|uniref:pentapeptide MXKDX repeat protein n=1 Tax=Caballeronia sp. J97 TaxID=2805429 RepID=UPI002AB2BAF6|nr:pentapeptide MXKDX repeat protein [Caballeronia sp. J97]